MRLFNINGKLINKNVSKYLIKWDKKCRSQIQFKVKKFLEPYWRGHIVYEEFPVYGTKLKVDIVNFTLKIAIEVQGNQHLTFNSFFHRTRNNFGKSLARDYRKYEWLQANEIKLLEILETEINELSEEYFQNKFGYSIINGTIFNNA